MSHHNTACTLEYAAIGDAPDICFNGRHESNKEVPMQLGPVCVASPQGTASLYGSVAARMSA